MQDASTREDSAAGDDASMRDDKDSGPVVVPPELPECAEHWVDKLGMHGANTNSAGNDFTLSCATGDANDSSFYFVVPQTAYYELSTKGTSIDNTLALMSASCNGTELACAAADDEQDAVILRKLEKDDEYVIVVDGNSGSHGAVELNVNRITCPGIDLTGQTLPLTASTSDGTNTHDGSCGGAGNREKAFLWTAPTDGLYAFTLTSDKIEPVLYVERGLRCGGELLGCSSGNKGGSRAQVTRRVNAGESVTLIVDSASGNGSFSLDVAMMSASACPGATRDPMNEPPVTRTLAPTDASLLTGSCLPTEITLTPGGTYQLAEHSYGIDVPSGYGCNISVEADGPVAMYIMKGKQCGGAETYCMNSEDESAPYFVSKSIGDFMSDTGSSWTVVVESSFPHSGTVTYTLSSSCFSP